MTKINKNIGFFVPVTYMPQPGILSTKSISTKLAELADNFFHYGKTRAYVTKMTGKKYQVKLIPCKSPIWKTALKIALLFSPLMPIMLAIKLIARINKKFEVTETTLERHKFEQVRFAKDDKAPYNDTDYKNICAKAGIELNLATPLQKHVLFFTDSEANMTRKSLQNGFQRLGSSKITAFLVSYVVFNRLKQLMKVKTDAIPLSDISKGTHPANTGVFNKDGTLDMDKFEVLKKTYPSLNPNYLTANDLEKMRKTNFQRDTAIENAKNGSLASKGEFLFTLNLFSDCALVDAHGNAQAAISLERLQKLYTNGPELFEEVALNPR